MSSIYFHGNYDNFGEYNNNVVIASFKPRNTIFLIVTIIAYIFSVINKSLRVAIVKSLSLEVTHFFTVAMMASLSVKYCLYCQSFTIFIYADEQIEILFISCPDNTNKLACWYWWNYLPPVRTFIVWPP